MADTDDPLARLAVAIFECDDAEIDACYAAAQDRVLIRKRPPRPYEQLPNSFYETLGYRIAHSQEDIVQHIRGGLPSDPHMPWEAGRE